MEEKKTYIIGSNCISCGKCNRVCLAKAVDTNAANKYYIHFDKCTGCGACQEICPVGAISGDDD